MVNLHREVHNLAGTTGCYQLMPLAAQAKKLENHLWIPLNKKAPALTTEDWEINLYSCMTSLTAYMDQLMQQE